MVHDLVATAPTRGAIHSTKIQIGPTGKSGPPQKADQKFWLNASRPRLTKLITLTSDNTNLIYTQTCVLTSVLKCVYS